MLSKCIMWTGAVTLGSVGLIEFGWIGGILMGFAGAGVGLWLVVRERMWR